MNRIIFIISFITLLIPKQLFSYGVGGYLSGSAGYISLNNDLKILDYPIANSSYSSITSSWGLGFTIDSNISSDNLFNYRFKLGYEKIYFNNGNNPAAFYFISSHIFGLKIYKNELVRLWVGPQLGINYQYILYEIRNGIIIDPIYLVINNGFFYKNTLRYYLLNLNSGIVFGCNFQFSKDFTLSIDLSILALYSTGYCKNKLSNITPSLSEKKSFCSAHGFESKFTITFMRRFKE